MRTDANKMIEARRKQLGLSEVQIAESIGTNIHSYCDIEWHADEIYTVTEARQIKKLCQVLRLDFFDLLGVQCAFCGEGKKFSLDYQLHRNKLVRNKREKLELTPEELGDQSNFYGYAIEGMERDPEYLERSTVESIVELASAIRIPLQILFGVKCPQCGR